LVLLYCLFWLMTRAAARNTGLAGDVADAKENMP
jgi:hypothetical protein